MVELVKLIVPALDSTTTARPSRRQPQRCWVLRLVQVQDFATGNLDRRQQAPAGIFNGFSEFDAFALKFFDRCLKVVAHQVKFVRSLPICGMNTQFSGRQGKNQPAPARVDCPESQYIPEERAELLRFLVVDKRNGYR